MKTPHAKIISAFILGAVLSGWVIKNEYQKTISAIQVMHRKNMELRDDLNRRRSEGE